MSKKKVLIISGSKSDELTAKLLKSFDNYSINYILIDFENFKLFFSLNKSSSNIKKNFSLKDLLDYIKQVDGKIKFKRDCIFLFEFRSGFSKNVAEYKLSLFELLKTYSTIIMTKDYQTMNIPKLPVFSTEDGIKTIKEFLGKLTEWKNLDELIPVIFKNGKRYKKTGKAGIFAGSLELVKEGNIKIKQDKLYDDIYVKEN